MSLQHPCATAASNSLGDIPRRTAGRYPGKLALVDGDIRFTFAEFNAVVDAAAVAIQAQGLGKGDVLALISRNNWQHAVLPFAAARAGVVLAPINFLLSDGEVAQVLELVKPRVLLAEAHLASTAASAAKLSGLELVLGGIGQGVMPDGWVDTASWFVPGPVPKPVEVADDDVIRLMFTSGTEAQPKAVKLTSRSLMWQYTTAIVSGGMTCDDIDLHIMPLYHCAQLDVFVIPDMVLGATSIILPSGGGGRIQKAIGEHGVTKLFATPSKWIELLHSPAFDAQVMGQLTKGYYGAAAMPVEVLKEIGRRLPNLRLWNFYGQTEMSPCATILPPEDQLAHAGSAGLPGLNVELAILDADSRPVPDGEVGEVAFRSPHACVGYLGDAAATEALFRGGWLHTGDRGYRAPGGRLHFVDRVKDTVNVGGEKVASREVEEVIYQMDGVQEVAVFGVPEPRFGEGVVAAVVAKPGAVVDPDAVRGFVRQRLAGFKTPRRVVVTDALPKNASGKILKRDLRTEYAHLLG